MMTFPGRWAYGMAAKRAPVSSIVRPMASRRAVPPSGAKVFMSRRGISGAGIEAKGTSYPVLNSTRDIRTGVWACSFCYWVRSSLKPETAVSAMDCIDPERSRMKAISVQLLAEVESVMDIGGVTETQCPRLPPMIPKD